MPVRKQYEKRTASPEEKAEKKRSETERTEKLRQHFPAWTGKYRSGGRSSLKEIAIFMNLADASDASEMFDHMRTFVFEPGTGYKIPFDRMAVSDKNRAFETLTNDEKHPLDVHTLTQGVGRVVRKAVTLKEIFRKKLFLESDWPESMGEPDEATWKLVVNSVKCWFHKDLTADTEPAKTKNRVSAKTARDRKRQLKEKNQPDQPEEHAGQGARPKRRITQATGSRKRKAVENEDGTDSDIGVSHLTRSEHCHDPAEASNSHCDWALVPFACRMMRFIYKHDEESWLFVSLMFAKPGIGEPQNATDLDRDAIIKAVRERWRLVGSLNFDGQPEEQVLEVVEEQAGSERTIRIEFDQSKAMRLD